MSKTKTDQTKITMTFRVDRKTAQVFKGIKHGCRSTLMKELVKNNRETIRRYTTTHQAA